MGATCPKKALTNRRFLTCGWTDKVSNRSSQTGYLKCRKLMGPQSSISVTLSMLFLAHQPWNGSILGVIARGELTRFGNSGLRVGLRRVRLTRIGRHDLGGVWKPPGERVVHLDLAKELRGASTGIKTKQQQPNPYGSPELAVRLPSVRRSSRSGIHEVHPLVVDALQFSLKFKPQNTIGVLARAGFASRRARKTQASISLTCMRRNCSRSWPNQKWAKVRKRK